MEFDDHYYSNTSKAIAKRLSSVLDSMCFFLNAMNVYFQSQDVIR